MELTKENKEKIDAMTYEQLLEHWRFAPAGDPWMSGQTGEYWKYSLHTCRNAPGCNEVHVSASKTLGWEKMNNDEPTLTQTDRSGQIGEFIPVMTLRDYFAGQVIGHLSALDNKCTTSELAAEAYDYADAMMKARNNR